VDKVPALWPGSVDWGSQALQYLLVLCLSGLQLGVILPLRDTWQNLETFLGWRHSLTSAGRGQGCRYTSCNTQHTLPTSNQSMNCPQVTTALKLRDPGLILWVPAFIAIEKMPGLCMKRRVSGCSLWFPVSWDSGFDPCNFSLRNAMLPQPPDQEDWEPSRLSWAHTPTQSWSWTQSCSYE
jgi:hypothetical protein